MEYFLIKEICLSNDEKTKTKREEELLIMDQYQHFHLDLAVHLTQHQSMQ